MEASSSKDTNGLLREELGLEDLWSELHALKKLYGLLHKTSMKIPNGDNGHDCLDEKSRIVLKKLLDCATHQALQSQAKAVALLQLVCYTPELPQYPPEKSENREPEISISTPKEAGSNQDQSQKSNPVSYGQRCKPEESTQTKQEAEPNPEAESKVRRPNVKRADLTLTRQSSRKSSKSAVISDKRSTRHYHHQHPHIHRRRRHHHRDGESSKLRPKNNDTENQKQNREDPNEQVKPRQSNGELFAVVPAEKRARVEPAGLLLGQSSRNKTRTVGPVDRELTHSKRGHAGEWPRGPRCKTPSRPGSLKEERETKSVAGDAKERLQQRWPHNSKAHHLKEREAKIVARKPRQIRDQIDLPPRKHPPLTRLESIGCSSSSQTARANSSSSSFSSPRRRVVRRVGPTRPPPRRMPSQRRNVAPLPPKKPAAENNEEGRLKRFKNKLAVIFHHHHHHHHHHLHRDADSDERARHQRQHRSPWAYLRSALHRTSGAGNGKGNELSKREQARAPAPQQRQRGYLYPLLDGLIRHVWGMRRRKRAKREGRKIAGRVQGKKLHWWQRFRRRGGVRLAINKAPRLRLGFNGAHSRNIRSKKST